MGRCQGGFCGPKVVEIIARYRNVPYEDVLQDNPGSYILTGETKSRRD
jgi:glycerol-3-phosphate dehydrogenase